MLIELLVVIAAIAVLSAILFPVFAKVREKARQTSCLTSPDCTASSWSQATCSAAGTGATGYAATFSLM